MRQDVKISTRLEKYCVCAFVANSREEQKCGLAKLELFETFNYSAE